MISIPKNQPGRMCNHIIKYLICYLISKKYNIPVFLKNVTYLKDSFLLGLNLQKFINFADNDKKYKSMGIDEKYVINLLNNDLIINNNYNYILVENNFCQQPNIIYHIVLYFNNPKNEICQEIISNNKYKNRYNNNNDAFIHIRAINSAMQRSGCKTKIPDFPTLEYYEKIIEKHINSVDNIYISSDNINNNIINSLMGKYNNLKKVNLSSVDTILFGSTCKHVILSCGSYSFIIGIFSFFSNIYFNKDAGKGWHSKFYTQFINKDNTIEIDCQ